MWKWTLTALEEDICKGGWYESYHCALVKYVLTYFKSTVSSQASRGISCPHPQLHSADRPSFSFPWAPLFWAEGMSGHLSPNFQSPASCWWLLSVMRAGELVQYCFPSWSQLLFSLHIWYHYSLPKILFKSLSSLKALLKNVCLLHRISQ